MQPGAFRFLNIRNRALQRPRLPLALWHPSCCMTYFAVPFDPRPELNANCRALPNFRAIIEHSVGCIAILIVTPHTHPQELPAMAIQEL